MAPSITSINGQSVLSIDVGSIAGIDVGSIAFAPVVISPGDPIAVGGSGFVQTLTGKRSWVRALGVTVGSDTQGTLPVWQVPRPPVAIRTVKERPPGPINMNPTPGLLNVLAPGLDDLETMNTKLTLASSGLLKLDLAYQYERNALVLPLAIQVCNPLVHPLPGSDSPVSDPVIILVKLPLPQIGTPTVQEQVVTIGELAGSSDVATRNLGRSCGNDDKNADSNGGQIRWYGLDQLAAVPNLCFRDFLPACAADATMWSSLVRVSEQLVNGTVVLESGVTLPDDAARTFAAIRDAGSWIHPPRGFTDRGVSFEIPDSTPFGDAGLVVVWRDDLPSAPQTIWNLDFGCRPQPASGPAITKVNDVQVCRLAGGVVAPLLVKPGDSLGIFGQGFPADGRVYARGVRTAGSDNGLLAQSAPSTTAILVQLPSLPELQTTDASVFSLAYRYQRNSMVLPLTLDVQTHHLPGFQRVTEPLVLAVLLPPPALGDPKLNGPQVTIGRANGVYDPGTHDLGDGVRGQLRWYGKDFLEQTAQFAVDLPQLAATDSASFWTFLTAAISNPLSILSQTATDGLADLRNLGDPVSCSWQDDGVSFTIPQDSPYGEVGLVVAWRDDIPSAPRLVWNFTIDCKDPSSDNQKLLQDKLTEICSTIWPPIAAIDLSVPLLPGHLIPLALLRLTAPLNSLAEHVLEGTPVSASFWFEVDGSEVMAPDSRLWLGDAQGQFVPNQPGQLALPANAGDATGAGLRVQPQIVSLQTAIPNAMLDIRVMGRLDFADSSPVLGGCQFDVPIGPTLRVTQTPVGIPTFAVFFTEKDFGGSPLFVLPQSEAIPGVPSGLHWDLDQPTPAGSDPGKTIEEIRDVIASKLRLADELVGLLRDLKVLPDSFKWFATVLDKVTAGSQFVIDSTGYLRDLRDTHLAGTDYNDKANSVILIGPPGTGITFYCYQNWRMNDGNGASGGFQLTMSQQSTSYVSAFPDLTDVTRTWQVTIDGFLVDVPTPGGAVDPPALTNVHDISSIYVDEPGRAWPQP